MQKVVDVNYFSDPRLRTFLKARKSNKVVLNEYGMIESYKGNAIRNIAKSTEIIREFHDQFVLLKCLRPLISVSGDARKLRSRLIDKRSTQGLSEFCHRIDLALAGDSSLKAQIEQHGVEASKRLDTMKNGAAALKNYIFETRSIYSPDQLNAFRESCCIGRELEDLLTKQVLLLFAFLHRDHPDTRGVPQTHTVPNKYLFRLSLAYCLLAIRWRAFGGSEDAREERLVNDLVDMNYVVAATYFDGLLTNDSKMKDIYVRSRFCLDHIFI